jgi:transposase
MKRFVEGDDRRQGALLPHCLDDYVTENNPVRVIEAFIDELDLATLGFDGVVPETTGRPAYHPATLLKIYLYGYLNRVQSSRRLEREAQRNIELMWLPTARPSQRRPAVDVRVAAVVISGAPRSAVLNFRRPHLV